jgi:hypothetical protein
MRARRTPAPLELGEPEVEQPDLSIRVDVDVAGLAADDYRMLLAETRHVHSDATFSDGPERTITREPTGSVVRFGYAGREEARPMTGREFMNNVVNGEVDVLEMLLRMLEDTKSDYCVIGGLAVNAYAEPVVSLDLDLVVVSARIADMIEAAESAGMKVEDFEHSINISVRGSDLRVQLQKDPRYQAFIPRAELHDVLGYQMVVACLEDVLAGKIWAFSDETRRGSKRQKDLADIMRLVETHPDLELLLPASIRAKFD